MTHKCDRHGCELKIRWYKEGTPREDFDGYYCPECECEKEAKRAKEKTDRENNPEAYRAYCEAVKLESEIRRNKYTRDEFVGRDVPEDRWEKSNRWWANRLQDF